MPCRIALPCGGDFGGTSRSEVRRILVDHDALRQAGRAVTAVIRIFPSTTRQGWSDEILDTCDQLIREIAQTWTLEHSKGVGIQIDYDCPDRHLGEFHQQIRRWKALVPGGI